MDELAEAVRAFREEQGLSQRDLAELVSIHQTTVSQWERALHAPRPAQRSALQELGCSLPEIPHPEPEPEPEPEPPEISGETVKAWRMREDLSQGALARLLSVGQTAISAWEVDGTTPSAQARRELLALGCPSDATAPGTRCRRCTAFGDPEIPLVTPAIRERMAGLVNGELLELEPGLCLWCWMEAQGIDSRQFYESGAWKRVLDWRPRRDPLMDLCDEVRDAIAESNRTFLGVAHELGIPGKTMWRVMERQEVSLTREELEALCGFADLDVVAYASCVAG